MSLRKDQHKTFLYTIGSLFLKGFFTLLPLTLTAAILNLSFKILKRWLQPVYQLEPETFKKIPFSEFFLTFFFILFVGLILDTFILRKVWNAFEKLINKIPLIRPIYTGIQQLIHAFNPQDSASFKQVVLIEFPRKGIYSIGFVTSQVAKDLNPNGQSTYYNVFVPTTPNPTAGFFLMIDAENIKFTTLTRQEAMALIISGGIIQPERFTQ